VKWLLCRALQTPSLEILETAISVCVTRYTMCKQLLLEKVNILLKSYDKQIDDFSSGVELVNKVRELIESSKKVPRKGIRSIDEQSIMRATMHVVLPALAATLSILGVECEPPPTRGA
jgi:hypothetical protein